MGPCARRSNKSQDIPKYKCKSLKNDNAKLQRDLNEARKENNALRSIVNKNESECYKIHKLEKQVEVFSSRVKKYKERAKYKELEEILRQGRQRFKEDSTVCNEKLVNSSTNTDLSYGFNEQQLIQRVQCFETKPDIMKLGTKIDTTKVIRDTSGNIVNTNLSEIILAKDELILSLEKRVKDLNSRCETLTRKLKQNEEELKYFNLQKESFDGTKEHIHKRVQGFIAVQETNTRLKTRKHNLESENERSERLFSIQQSSMFSNSVKLNQSETLLKESEAQVSRLQDHVYLLTAERDKVKKEVSTYALHIKRLECEIKTLKDKIQTLTYIIDNCKSENHLCSKENNELHKRLSDIEDSATTLLEKENELKRSREERASLTRECRQKSKYIAQLREQCRNAAKQISELNNNRENETEIICRLNDDLQKAKIVEQQMNEKDRDIRQDKRKLLELTRKLEKCESKNNTINRLYTESQTREETLQKELENAKASLKAADSSSEEIARKYEISEHEKSELIIENQTLYDCLKRTQLDDDVCKEKNEQENRRLAKQLLNSETQYRDLEKRLGVLSEGKYELERKLSSLELQKEDGKTRQHEMETLYTEQQALLLKIESLKNEKCQFEKQIVELLECPNSAVCTNSVLDNLRKKLLENQELQCSLAHECDTNRTKLGQLEQQLQLASNKLLESQESQKAQTETICRLNNDLQKAKIVEQQMNEKDRGIRQDKRKLLELMRKLENCENENNTINRLYTESQNQEETLKKELENANASLKAADKSLKEIVRKYEISELEKSELIMENQKLSDNLKRTQLDDDACKEQNEQENRRLAKQLLNSETQYRDLEKRLSVLSKEKYELKRKLSSLELQKEDVKKRQHETEILKTEQQALLLKFESLKNEKCKFEKQIVELLECPNSAVCTNSVLDNLRKRLLENQELQCSLAHECDTNRTKLGQLEQQLQLASNKLLESQESQKAQTETICRLNDDLKKAKIVEQQLNEKDRDHRQDKSKLLELTTKLEKCESKNNTINRLYTESQTREETLKNQLENAKASLKAADSSLEDIARRYEISEHEKSELIIEYQTLHDSLKHKQLDDDACKEKNEQENRCLAKQLSNSKTQYRDLEKRLGVLSEEKNKLERKLSSLELQKEDVKKRQHETETLKTEQQALLLKIESLKNEKCQFEKQIVELLECPNSAVCTNSALDNLRKRLLENQELQSSLAHECDTNRTKLGHLEQQLQLASSRFLELQESKKAQTETICRLNDDLQKAKIVEQQFNEKDRDLQQDKRKLHELTRRLEKCESKNSTINRLYTESQTREETLKQELENSKASLKAADSNLEEIARKYEISEHENSELIIENQTLYDNLKRTQLGNDACKEKNEQENRRLAKQLSNSETHCCDLEKRLGFLSEEKYELERKLSIFELQKESVEKRQHEIEILNTEQQALLKKIESLKNHKCKFEKQIVELLECPSSAVCTYPVLDNLRKRLVENQELQCSLAHECESKKTKLGQLEQQLQLHVNEISALNERNKIQADKIIRLNEDFQTAKIVEQQLNNKCRDLLQDTNNLREQSKSFDALAKQLENSENEKANVNQLYKEGKKRETELIKTLETTEAMLMEVQEQANKISQKYDTCRNQNIQLLKDIQDCHAQLKSAQQNLIAAEKSFNSKLKSELDRNEAENLKQSEKYTKKIYELNKEIERAKKANFDDDHGAQDKLARANKDLAETRRELEETKTRLSKLMGQKLTNNNPNIADLSDQNRPTKLAERYTELYDNQWTDAFEVIDQGNEQATIDLLMQILYDCFTFCVKESMRQLDNLRSVLMLRKGQVVVSEILNKQLKDCRKAVAIESGQHLLETYMADLQQNGSDLSKVAKKVPSYVKECFSVCWLMSIQDPSLVLGNSDQVRPGAAFNSEQYKAYTESGPVVEFLVWPAMFLYKDGPLLCKGVAQGRRSSRKH